MLPVTLNSVELGCVAISAGLVLGMLAVIRRCRERDRMLRALVESFDKPLLFYNEYGRLAFHSSGLILFDKKSSFKAIKSPPAQPTKNQPQFGIIVIDHNRYRFFSRQYEYAPGKTGVLVLLEYQGSETASP